MLTRMKAKRVLSAVNKATSRSTKEQISPMNICMTYGFVLSLSLSLLGDMSSPLSEHHLALESPNMCLREQLHYAPVTVTTHKSWWSSAFIPAHKSTDTHHRHCTTTVVTGESFVAKAGLALIEMGGKKKRKNPWVSSLCLWGQSGEQKSRLLQTI